MKPGRAKPVGSPDSILKGPTKVVVPSGRKRAIQVGYVVGHSLPSFRLYSPHDFRE
jgi:hypothetical protein